MQSCHIIYFCYVSSLHVSVCLRFAVRCQRVCTCQWAPFERIQPAIRSSRRPYSASLSPSNSPGACGRLLPFRQGPWFLPVGVRGLSCVMRIWEPFSSSFSFSFAPPLLRRCCWGVTCGSGRPRCPNALVQIPVHSPPKGNGSLKPGRLERVESQWLITGCAGTRGQSEAPVVWEQERRGKGRKVIKKRRRSCYSSKWNVSTEREWSAD